MNLVEFAQNIILSIVDNKDVAIVKEFPSENDKEIVMQVLVDKDDMPKVIGKNGKVINAVRTLVQASSYKQENKLVKINVDSI